MISLLPHRGRAFIALALAAAMPATALAAGNLPWVGTWGVSPTSMNPVNYGGHTLREIVHTSVSGTRTRLRFSNEFGDAPLVIADVHLALRTSGSSVDGASDHVATFAGQAAVTIPVGGTASSDAVDMLIPESSDVTVSFYVPEATHAVTGHSFSDQSKYVAVGDVSGQPDISAQEDGDYFFLTNMDVQGDGLQGTIVALGASATDGYQSTYNANHRYPNFLASRLNAAGMKTGIINEGISGNSLVSGDTSILNRFAQDALNQPSVRWIIFGDAPMNDILSSDTSVADMVAAYKVLIDQAHAKGLKFICATMPTFHAAPNWTADRQARVDGLDAFILTANNGCDGVADLHHVLEDPSNPNYTLPAYSASDNLHPNDAGYEAYADSINLSYFPPVILAPIIPPAICGTIESGQGLLTGQSLVSCDGTHAVTLRSDGNLVLTSGSSTLIETQTSGSDAAEAFLTADGSFELRGALGELLWTSNSGGQSAARMYLQADGNLVIYTPGGLSWASNTAGR